MNTDRTPPVRDEAPPKEVAALLPGETVRLRLRPGAPFLVLTDLALGGLALAATAWLLPRVTPEEVARVLGWARGWLLWAAALMILWNSIDWLMRAYILTDRRIVRASGVLQRVAVDVPLRNVQSVVLVRSIRERLIGLGSVGVSTAGSAGLEFTWFMVARPQECLNQIRAAVEEHRGATAGGIPGGPA